MQDRVVHGCARRRAAGRADWCLRRPRLRRASTACSERPECATSASCNERHNYFDRDRTLRVCDASLDAWGRVHELLGRALQQRQRGELSAAANSYLEWAHQVADQYVAVHAAMRAGGARCMRANAQRGVNCALFAVGEHIGFSATQSADGLPGSVRPDWRPSMDHILSAETLLKALSGDAANDAAVTHMPFWHELLVDVGFTAVDECAVGDAIVYTLRQDTVAVRAEVSCHYGVVRSVGAPPPTLWPPDGGDGAASRRPPPPPPHVWVESKLGTNDALPTYLHPLHVIDPVYLIFAESVGVHAFRPPAPPQPGDAATARLYALACKYERRMEMWGREPAPGAPQRTLEWLDAQLAPQPPHTVLRGSCVSWEGGKPPGVG